MFFIVFMAKKNAVFKIYFQPLIIELFWFAKLWLRIEEKTHTKTVSDVSRRSFGSCSVCGGGVWGTNHSLGERCAWEGLGVGLNFENKL